MMKLLKGGAIVALAVAVLVWPACWLMAQQAEAYQAIEPGDADTIRANQQLYGLDPTGDRLEITKIYGAPLGEPTKYVFVDEARVIRPEEAPDLQLLQVRKTEDENPLQLQTVELLTLYTSVGAAVASLVLFAALAFLRRRRARAAARSS